MFQMLKAAYRYCQKDVREVAADLKGAALGIITGVAIAAGSVTPQNAVAAVPEALTTAYADAQADFLSLFDLAIPAMVIVAGSLLIWRYGKSFIKSL